MVSLKVHDANPDKPPNGLDSPRGALFRWFTITMGTFVVTPLAATWFCAPDVTRTSMNPTASELRTAVVDGYPYQPGVVTDRTTKAWYPSFTHDLRGRLRWQPTPDGENSMPRLAAQRGRSRRVCNCPRSCQPSGF